MKMGIRSFVGRFALAWLLGAPLAGQPMAAQALPRESVGDLATRGEVVLPAPIRIRRWPRLTAWLRGAEIDGTPTQGPAASEGPLRAHGAAVYSLYCVNCHGVSGRGDGPRSPVFDPPPRDFTQGVYKFRGTPFGQAPTAEDLFRTITAGLRGTGMVSFADLPEIDRWALVAYLRSLSTVFEKSAFPEGVALPTVPERLDSPQRITAGKKAYTRLACGTCHGPLGRGDGPAAAGLIDLQGRPIRPRDFVTQPFKRGSRPATIYTTLVTGLNGTPMVSFAGLADEDELWALVAYVRSLGKEGLKTVDPTDLAEARRVVAFQQAQGQHATQGGCGCSARKSGGKCQ